MESNLGIKLFKCNTIREIFNCFEIEEIVVNCNCDEKRNNNDVRN